MKYNSFTFLVKCFLCLYGVNLFNMLFCVEHTVLFQDFTEILKIYKYTNSRHIFAVFYCVFCRVRSSKLNTICILNNTLKSK